MYVCVYSNTFLIYLDVQYVYFNLVVCLFISLYIVVGTV